jgi:hypothetical protein
VLVLDEYGISLFDAAVVNVLASTRICGGGRVTSLGRDDEVACTLLDFASMGVSSMASGRIGGRWSVVWTWSGGVAYMGDGVARALLRGDALYQHVLFAGGRLLAVKCGGGECEGVEAATSSCLCDEGFVCADGQCLQVGVGAFAPSWSTAEVPCQAGTVGTAPGKGSRTEACSSDGGAFTTHGQGALAWEPRCASPSMWFDAARQTCVQGCDPDKGEYRDVLASACKTCRQGTRPVDGVGCELCAPGTFGTENGTCGVCPVNTSTLYAGAHRCAGVGDRCADGGVECTDGTTTQVAAAATDMDMVGNTLYVATEHVVWAVPADGGSRWEVAAGEYKYGVIALNDEATMILSAATGGRCVWKTEIGSGATVLAGQCGGTGPFGGDRDGTAQSATFSSIAALAYMHVNGKTPVLYVSSPVSGSEGQWCGAVRAVSLFDGSVSTFASQDDARMNRRTLSACLSGGRLGVRVPRGTDRVYLFHKDVGLLQIRNDGVYEAVTLYAKENYAIEVRPCACLSRLVGG